MESGTHTEPDWGVRLGLAALAIGGYLAFTQSGIFWAVLFGVPVGLTVVIWISWRAILDRALRKPVTRSRMVLRAACVALTLTGVPVWVWYAFGPGYYREYNRVKDQLAAIPGVTLIGSGGNADLTFEDISAHIRVRDRGDLSVWALTEDSFSSARNLALAGIDRYSFHWTQCGYHGVFNRDRKPVRSMAGGFTLGLRGHEIYAGKQLIGTLPVPIRTVQELVTHYDVVTAWLDEHQGKMFGVDGPDGEMTWLIIPNPPLGRKTWVARSPWQRQQPNPQLRQMFSRACR
jgi:hypothetical protein